MKKSQLNIFSYRDFRLFIRDRLAELKAIDSKYSYQFLASRLGIASKSHIKMVVDAKHNISIELAERLGGIFELNRREQDFFLALVDYGQAADERCKQAALERLCAFGSFSKLHRLDLKQMDYYADPLMLALREMVELKDFSESPAYISSRLPYKVSTAGIRKAIAKLIELGLLERDTAGRLRHCEHHIATGDDMRSLAVRKYYRQRFKEASAALEIPADRRRLGGLSCAVSRSTYKKICDILEESLGRIYVLLDEEEEADEVYQLVTAIYPLTRPASTYTDKKSANCTPDSKGDMK